MNFYRSCHSLLKDFFIQCCLLSVLDHMEEQLGLKEGTLCIWKGTPKNHRWLVENPNSRSEFSRYDLLRSSNNQAIVIAVGGMPGVDSKVSFAEETMFFGYRIYRNQTGPELEAPSLLLWCQMFPWRLLKDIFFTSPTHIWNCVYYNANMMGKMCSQSHHVCYRCIPTIF